MNEDIKLILAILGVAFFIYVALTFPLLWLLIQVMFVLYILNKHKHNFENLKRLVNKIVK